MNLLLDTHVLMRCLDDPTQIIRSGIDIHKRHK